VTRIEEIKARVEIEESIQEMELEPHESLVACALDRADDCRFLLARIEKLEAAICKVLADSESVDGGWGPDVRTRGYLIDALKP